jgi:hydrogenase expression/formation protein HypC
MCLGIPGMVIERDDPNVVMPFGLVEFAGLRRRVCLACVSEAQPGDYVVVHAGIAISRIDAGEAARVLEHLREMGETDGWDPERKP